VVDANPALREFAARKTREAEAASIHPLVTFEEDPLARNLQTIGSAWTRRMYDGGFHLIEPPPDRPAVSLVFVQSLEGNTGADNPADLGGGATDAHLIYEGLSRAAADAVLAGAATASGAQAFFSVWRQEIVSLRLELGLPRHPAQIVVSNDGRVDAAGTLLFNVPEVPVYLIAGAACRERCADLLSSRPWITVLPLDVGGLGGALAQLRTRHGVSRISAIGGRATATSLIDAGLVQDLCLTTTSRRAGDPDTPFYAGEYPPTLGPIVRKRGTDPRAPIVFEHQRVGPRG
jgi:riboflavin biosynthesis pyrimidine reductase